MLIKICIAWILIWGSAEASAHCRDFISLLNQATGSRLADFVRNQETGASCSVASTLALVNFFRAQAGLPLLPNEKVFLEQAQNMEWRLATQQGGTGISLNQLFEFLKDSFPKFGLKKHVEIRSVGEGHEFLIQWERDLKWKSQNPRDRVLLLNLDQGVLFNEVGEGHFVLVGKIDLKRRKVELLDSDPEVEFGKSYEVSMDHLARTMLSGKDPFGFPRGYLKIF